METEKPADVSDDSLHSLPIPQGYVYKQDVDAIITSYEILLTATKQKHEEELHEAHQAGMLAGQRLALTDARQAIQTLEGQLRGLNSETG